MANQPYFPTREGDQIAFFTNLQTKTPRYATALDISAARQTKLQLALAWLIWAWQTYLPARRADGPAATAWRNALASGTGGGDATPPGPTPLTPPAGTPFFGMLTWLQEEIARWKTAEGYTDTIGRDLGIIGGGASELDPATLHPDLTVRRNGAQVDVLWGWQGHRGELDLIELEVDRSDGKGYSLLSYDSTPNYNDTAAQPATPAQWKYRGVYRVNDQRIGQWSPEVAVTVGG